MDFALSELCERAGVTPRTVRYYIQQGLLPPAERAGPSSRYRQEHLERLHLIRTLKQRHLPLAEIRLQLEQLTPEQIRSMAEIPADQDTAADYVRRVMQRPKGSGR